MARALRIVAIILVALIVLLATAVFAITRLIDPNDFKPQIEALALEHGGLDLDMQGDLGWTFWPTLGVSIGRTEARLADEEELFAALDEAAVGVRVWPLLSRRVEMNELRVDGLHLELVEDADGGNWERVGPRDAAAEVDETLEEARDEEEAAALDIPVSIPQLSLRNGEVRYRNLVDDTDIHVDRFTLTARNLSLDEPFPLEAILRYRDQDELTAELSLDTVVGLDLEAERYRLDPLEASAWIAGVTPRALRVRAHQSILADLGEDRVEIRELILEAAGTRTTGELELTGLTTTPRFRGRLDTETFNLHEVLTGLGEEPPATTDGNALTRIALQAELDGPAGSLMLDPLTVTLDDSTLSGRAGLEDLEAGAILFDLDLDHLALDGYLPPETGAADPEPDGEPQPLSEEPLLPLETLRALRLDGRLGIGALRLEDIEARDLEFRMTAADGQLALTRADGSTLDGTFSASGSLDARTDNPRLGFNATATSVQIQPIMQRMLEDDLFIGLIDLDTAIEARGNSEKALMESAAGHFDFSLTDGTVRGMNLHNVLAGGINDMLERYDVLRGFMEGLDDGRRPRELREDTEILDLHARTRLADQVAHLDELRAELDRGARLHGDGWLNLRDDDFEFDLRMRAPGLSSNPRIAEREWPLRCAGNLAESPARWCRPRGEAFRNAGRELVERLVRQEVEERLGVDTDKAEEEVRERVREKRDEAEEKLRDRARDRLEGLFR